jgi:hypothetical protein
MGLVQSDNFFPNFQDSNRKLRFIEAVVFFCVVTLVVYSSTGTVFLLVVEK